MTEPITVRPRATLTAWQFDGTQESAAAITDWVDAGSERKSRIHGHPTRGLCLEIPVYPASSVIVGIGDWVFKGIFGDFQRLPDERFAETYEVIGKQPRPYDRSATNIAILDVKRGKGFRMESK